MAITQRFVVLLLASVLATPSIAADEKKPQELKGWGTVVDPDGDCRVTEKEGALTIVTPGKHHDLTYTEKYTKLNAPRVVQETKGDFVVEVEVQKFKLPQPNTSSGGDFRFVSGGLLIWQDDKNYIRLERASEGSSGLSPFAWVERFSDGKSEKSNLDRLTEQPTQLRAERKGNQFRFSFREAGQTSWKEFFADEVVLDESLKVGVLTINSTTDQTTVQFKGLKLNSK